jgi:hypothetical protein
MGNCITYSWNKGAYMHTEALFILIAWCEGSSTILKSLLICYHVFYYNTMYADAQDLSSKKNEMKPLVFSYLVNWDCMI